MILMVSSAPEVCGLVLGPSIPDHSQRGQVDVFRALSEDSSHLTHKHHFEYWGEDQCL